MFGGTRFDRFVLDELWRAYYDARKHKRGTFDEHKFELNAADNIMNLYESIQRRVYEPSRGVTFIIHEPVIREIVAAPFRDRLVHHFLCNICMGWWDRRLIPDSYSCRKGKGTLYGQRRLQHHIRLAKNESATNQAFVVKLDLQGYFMSLRHNKLYERVLWGMEQQFQDHERTREENGIRCNEEDIAKLYDLLKYLWWEVIFDRAMNGIRLRGQRSDWRDLPPSKSLFSQPLGQGIVIGNLTSQLLSNLYMDTFDRFAKFELGYRHYGRYVDDFFIVVPMEEKEKLLADVGVIERYLRNELSLTLHPDKRYLQDAARGVAFVGGMVYAHRIVPGKRMRKRYRNAVYRLVTQGEGKIEGIVARSGSMSHMGSGDFLAEVFESVGW